MTDKISIIGSTGSIGTQTLTVARELGIKVLALSANSNVELLEKQAREFLPAVVSINDETLYSDLKFKLKDTNIEVLCGTDGMVQAATLPEVSMVVTAVVGISGLIPTLKAINAGKDIALANKETLVTAGPIVMEEAKKNNVKIIPVDSEHSAIFQSLRGYNKSEIEKVIITASGGPFRGKAIEEMENVTLYDALKHPNWNMGKKITVDSATMMNKGLEVIEAKHLFGVEADMIEVVIHPQSIIHSAVQYKDGSIIAQMGLPSMLTPIQFALTFPERAKNSFKRFDFYKHPELTFEKPDTKAFPCLQYAFDALNMGGNAAAVLNAANEVAVEMFLKEKIKFTDIAKIINKVLNNFDFIRNPGIDDIIYSDNWCREYLTG